MFRIGEFAQIAQVSQRQLRHYDQLGLLKPRHVDAESGYRFYSASQLPRLNRILALKDLGFSLEQIGPLIDDEIGADELRAMLRLKLAQTEQALREGASRLRQIESRIAQVEAGHAMQDYDVVVKSTQATPYLSTRAACESMEEAVAMLRLVAVEGARQVRAALRQNLVVVARPDFAGDALDLEFGFALTRPSNASVRLSGGYVMAMSELPEVDAMATLVRSGPDYQSHNAFGALATWIETNGYEISGPCREVFVEPPNFSGDSVVEIQFPISATV
jgi:DNA-binding transcriptional MerR regulator